MPEVYGRAFFDDQSEGSLTSARRVVPTLMEWFGPRSVIDVGCGVGSWLAAFQEAGVADVLGVDGDYVDRAQLRIPAENFVPRDLARPLDLGRKADLVVSLEVGEHLPPGSAGTLVDSLVRLGPVVLFSAAIPGQGGTHHVNEQWPGYWKALFESRGYRMVDRLRARFWDDDEVGACYRQNMFLYLDQERDFGPAFAPDAATSGLPLTAVHPGVFQHASSRPLTLRPILRGLPGALAGAIRSRLGSR